MSEKNKANNSVALSKNEIDLATLLGAIVDNRWLVIGLSTIALVAALLYCIFTTPIYRADALIQVEPKAGGNILQSISQIIPSSQQASGAEMALIKSRMVIGKTIDDLNLDISLKEKFTPFIGKGFNRFLNKQSSRVEISRFDVPAGWANIPLELKVIDKDNYTLKNDGVKILEGKVGKLASVNGITILISDIEVRDGRDFILTKRSELDAINSILANFNAEDKGKDTGVLTLTLLGEDPQAIQIILNSIASNYLLQNVERKSEEAAKSLAFLKEQLPDIKMKLDSAENKLNTFRQKNDSVDLNLEAKSLLDTLVSTETQLNELTFKEAEISKLYTKEHPAYRSLLEKRKTLEEDRNKLNKRISAMPQTQQEILRLTRDVKSGQEIYMQLLNKQQELNINKASTVGNVRIVDPAITQPYPVEPRKAIILILSLFCGVLFSLIIVIIKVFMHRGIENPEQLEELGINVYASIPLSDWQRKKDHELSLKKRRNQQGRSNSLLSLSNPTDLAVEAIRSLRTSLHFAMLEAKNNVLMISGASPSIGKTFLSTNLAAVIAQSGQRILMIDADLRKGYVHEILSCSKEDGFTEILTGKVTPEKAIKKNPVDNLDFIPRGQIPPNPSELLMNPRCKSLIDWASENYDLVIIDTPPILAVTDAAILGRHVGTVLMVARFDVNTPKEVEVSIKRFENNGIKVKGVIINAVVRKAASANSYGYYQYEYKASKDS